MASTVEVSCDGCGAPLEVGDEARFATCGFCDARLEVRHSDSAVWTKAIEKLKKGQRKLAARQERMSGELALVKLENELERVERDWADAREAYMIRSKDGTLHEPRSQEPWMWLSGVLVVLAGIYCGIQVESAGFGLAMTLFMGIAFAIGYLRFRNRLRRYDAAYAVYDERRSDLERRIAELE